MGELITLTAGRQNELIDCEEGHIHLAALRIIDVKTRWILTQELLELAYQLLEFTKKWFKNSTL